MAERGGTMESLRKDEPSAVSLIIPSSFIATRIRRENSKKGRLA